MQAHGFDHDERVTIDGPSAMLDVESAQTFALALHELTTNAVKYGALQETGTGRLRIAWTVSEREGAWTLALAWRESGVAMPPDTSRQGYGRALIERALPFSLRAKIELVFGADGVSCHIEVPLPDAGPTLPDPNADEG